MTHKLVIAEKPSVARSIAGVIGATEKHAGYLEGNGYVVSWCIGHVIPCGINLLTKVPIRRFWIQVGSA